MIHRERSRASVLHPSGRIAVHRSNDSEPWSLDNAFSLIEGTRRHEERGQRLLYAMLSRCPDTVICRVANPAVDGPRWKKTSSVEPGSTYVVKADAKLNALKPPSVPEKVGTRKIVGIWVPGLTMSSSNATCTVNGVSPPVMSAFPVTDSTTSLCSGGTV